MFRNKSSRTRSATPTVIAQGTLIMGSIRVAGAIQIDGQIEGAVVAEADAAVGATGKVLGDIFADELRIDGYVGGTVSVRDHLHLGASGRVDGDVRYGSLQVERGGVIAGSALHGEDVITIDAEDCEDAAPALPEAASAPS
jgi:cytoskeletal protein CcmA (bactofilin family)